MCNAFGLAPAAACQTLAVATPGTTRRCPQPRLLPTSALMVVFFSKRSLIGWARIADTSLSTAIRASSLSLKAKKILVGRARLIEEKGPLVRCIECVAHATRRDTGGPRDAVEGRAVEAASQAGSADRIWS